MQSSLIPLIRQSWARLPKNFLQFCEMLSARCHSSTSQVRSSVDDSHRSSKPDDNSKVARSKVGHNIRRSRGGRSTRRNRVESRRLDRSYRTGTGTEAEYRKSRLWPGPGIAREPARK